MNEHGTIVRQFPADVLKAARQAADEVLDELAELDDITARIVGSYRATRDTQIEWSKISRVPFLESRVA